MRLDERDRVLLGELEAFLRGLCSGYNNDDFVFRSAEPLAARLRDLRRKLWPVDPPRKRRRA